VDGVKKGAEKEDVASIAKAVKAMGPDAYAKYREEMLRRQRTH
jgi:hypothetical protein